MADDSSKFDIPNVTHPNKALLPQRIYYYHTKVSILLSYHLSDYEKKIYLPNVQTNVPAFKAFIVTSPWYKR